MENQKKAKSSDPSKSPANLEKGRLEPESERLARKMLQKDEKQDTEDRGDEHFPGQVNAERIRLGKDLPRRQ